MGKYALTFLEQVIYDAVKNNDVKLLAHLSEGRKENGPSPWDGKKGWYLGTTITIRGSGTGKTTSSVETTKKGTKVIVKEFV